MDSEIKEIAQQRKKFIGSLTSNHFFIYLSIYMFLINWKHLGILIFGEETVEDRIETFSSRYYGSKFMFWEYSFWENGWMVLLLCGGLAWLSWKFLPHVNFEIKKYTGKHERKLIVENDQKTAIEKWRVENPKEVNSYEKKIEEQEKAYENEIIVFEKQIMTLRESERKFKALLAETTAFIKDNGPGKVAEIDPIVLPYDPNSADKKLTIGEKGFANWRSRKEHKSKPQRLPKDTKSQDKNAPGYPWP